MFVLALPLAARSDLLTIAAFVGGLSAATAMVIVESVALAIMVSNDIVMPLVLQRREDLITGRDNIGGLLLTVRRVAIFVILFLAYIYYRLAGDAQLASIGLLSFAAVAQLAPAFFGGLIWRRATARGAMAGMTVGILVWAYTLLLPNFADAGIVGQSILTQGPWGIALLRPQALFGLDLPPLAHGVVWSLLLNVLSLCGILVRARAGLDRAAAGRPVRAVRSHAYPAELSAVALVGHGRGTDHDGLALSRRGAHPHVVRQLCAHPRREPRSQERRGLPAPALRRASARLGDRRGVVPPRAVAAPAQAHGVHQGRAQAARRRQCGDPLQPRDPADRARSRAPGHRGIRQGPAPRLLEPAVRRDSGAAALAHPRRHRPR